MMSYRVSIAEQATAKCNLFVNYKIGNNWDLQHGRNPIQYMAGKHAVITLKTQIKAIQIKQPNCRKQIISASFLFVPLKISTQCINVVIYTNINQSEFCGKSLMLNKFLAFQILTLYFSYKCVLNSDNWLKQAFNFVCS